MVYSGQITIYISTLVLYIHCVSHTAGRYILLLNIYT